MDPCLPALTHQAPRSTRHSVCRALFSTVADEATTRMRTEAIPMDLVGPRAYPVSMGYSGISQRICGLRDCEVINVTRNAQDSTSQRVDSDELVRADETPLETEGSGRTASDVDAGLGNRDPGSRDRQGTHDRDEEGRPKGRPIDRSND
jgi:hypothetical protein